MPVSKKPQDKFSRYVDASGQFTNNELKAGEWYVAHKLVLRTILIWILGIWCVLSVGYGLIGWVMYYTSGYFKDRALVRSSVAQFQNYTQIQENYKAIPLDLNSIQVYSPVDNRYDFVTKATNNNERIVIRLKYHYEFAGGKTETSDIVVLPKSTVPVASLGQASDMYPSNPVLKFDEIKYERINAHVIPRIKDFLTQRTRFRVENPEFIPPTEGVVASRVKFDIINDTVFSFWEPLYFVEVISGGTTIGIFSITVPELKAEERRALDVSTFIDISGADDIRITPIIDIFDQSVFIKP